MKTQADLVDVCEEILSDIAGGHDEPTVGGVQFVKEWMGECQHTARLVYEATTGQDMPCASCCATHTQLLLRKAILDGDFDGYPAVVDYNYDPEGYDFDWDKFPVGAYIYFSGGGPCHTCGNPVGHVGVKLRSESSTGAQRMFQDTSRDGLGITQEGPTDAQKARFAAAFQMLAD